MRVENKIKKLIKKSKTIFISGHKNLDLDAIGACIGISAICNNFNKENYIIIDDEKIELGVQKILNENTQSLKLIKSEDIPKYYNKNSILVIVDTNKAQLLQNDKILHYFNNIIILDHHQETDQTLLNTTHIIDTTKSSACEIVTYLIKEYKVPLKKSEATSLLSGIILDTNNLTVKTTYNTYYATYILSKLGADAKKVQSYLKQDLNSYIERQKVITGVKLLYDKYAIALGLSNKKYEREELAKIAETLLKFNNIEASFVIGKRIDGFIGLSARSEGLVDVGKIAESLGGGGDNYNAASQIKDMKVEEVEKELINILNQEV